MPKGGAEWDACLTNTASLWEEISAKAILKMKNTATLPARVQQEFQ